MLVQVKYSLWEREHGAKRTGPYLCLSQPSNKAVLEINSKLADLVFCWRQANAMVVQKGFFLDHLQMCTSKSSEDGCSDKLRGKREISCPSVKPTGNLTILLWLWFHLNLRSSCMNCHLNVVIL